MTLSEMDRDRIISSLDRMDEVAAQIVVASFEAFTRWLARELPTIFARIRYEIQQIWTAVKRAFA